MGKLIPIILVLVALLGGAGAGYVLRPPAGDSAAEGGHAASEAAHEEDHGDEHAASDGHDEASHGDSHGDAPAGETEFVKLNNQFIVPLIEQGQMKAMVLLSLSLEVTSGSKEAVYAVEPKLRDVFLRAMFDHANAGGFDGVYTQRDRLDVLRAALAEIARPLLGDQIRSVLIEEIVRQDSR